MVRETSGSNDLLRKIHGYLLSVNKTIELLGCASERAYRQAINFTLYSREEEDTESGVFVCEYPQKIVIGWPYYQVEFLFNVDSDNQKQIDVNGTLEQIKIVGKLLDFPMTVFHQKVTEFAYYPDAHLDSLDHDSSSILSSSC